MSTLPRADRVADVVIIGAGVMGCAAAYHLAKAGTRVVVLEKCDVAYEASGRNRGNVRLQLRHPQELPIAREAVRRWRQIDDELGMATEYRTVGNLLVTYHEETVEGLVEEVQRHRALGLEANLLRRAELKELVPGLSDAIVAGLYTPDDGHVNPQRATFAFASAARRAGARIMTGVSVQSIRVEGGRARGVRTDGGEFASEVVLNAAGVRAPSLCAPLGLNLPITPALHQVLVSARVPPVSSPYLRCAGPRVSFVQTLDGTLLLGMGPAQHVGFSSSLSRTHISRTMRETIRLVPTLRDVRVVRAWTGWFEMTPDDLPILGPAEGIAGLVIAAGFSGHGFAVAPAVGELLAEAILKQPTSLSIERFRASRFSEPLAPVEEPMSKIASLSRLTAEGLH